MGSQYKGPGVTMHLNKNLASVSLWLFICVLSILGQSCSSTEFTAAPETTETLPYTLVDDHQTFLQSGEHLEYHISTGILHIGKLVSKLRLVETANGPVFEFHNSTTPTPLAASLADYGGIATSWAHPESLRPKSYLWTSFANNPVKRRYVRFEHDQQTARGAEVHGEDWEFDTQNLGVALDPCSVLFWLRVLKLEPQETLRVHLVEGTKLRLCTVIYQGIEQQIAPGKKKIAADLYTFRIDALEDGQLTDAPAETDFRTWIARDDSRVILLSDGQMKGQAVRIQLKSRTLPEVIESGS